MNSFEGQFLVAMPDMVDDRFARSVVYVVRHNREGAMGLIVNHRVKNLGFGDILNELELGDPDAIIRLPDRIRDRAVMSGGPVEIGRGFVLHSADYRSGDTIMTASQVCLTTTLDILRAMAFGPAPKAALLALGCSGWGPGQLEAEIADNGWLTVPFSPEIIFDAPIADRYDLALAKLHITRASLSSDAGHA